MLSAQVGPRTLAMAQAVRHQIAERLAPGCMPLFLSDPPRRQERGPMPKPRWMPLPGLLYAKCAQRQTKRGQRGADHRFLGLMSG